jgi:hypothetical protein
MKQITGGEYVHDCLRTFHNTSRNIGAIFQCEDCNQYWILHSIDDRVLEKMYARLPAKKALKLIAKSPRLEQETP